MNSLVESCINKTPTDTTSDHVSDIVNYQKHSYQLIPQLEMAMITNW